MITLKIMTTEKKFNIKYKPNITLKNQAQYYDGYCRNVPYKLYSGYHKKFLTNNELSTEIRYLLPNNIFDKIKPESTLFLKFWVHLDMYKIDDETIYDETKAQKINNELMNNKNKFSVILKDLNNKLLVIDVTNELTLFNIRQLLLHIYDISVQKCLDSRFVYKGVHLDDTKTIGSYKISANDVISIFIVLRGS